MGWADIGANGSKFHETPNIDRLAAGGMRFTQGYAACPVCSPTRASILTGRHPVRVDITDWIPGQSGKSNGNPLITPADRANLAHKEVTIAESLKGHGYQTFFAGKWHLGHEGHWPTDQGFDINIGGHHRGSPPGGYYAPWTNPALKSKKKGEYLTERLTEESVKFLEARDASKPFLLYLSYYNIHTPIQAYKKHIEKYQAKAAKQFKGKTPTRPEHEGTNRMRQDNAALASMVAAVDDSVGTLLGKLKELKLDQNTVVIFFSDNGGLSTLRRGRFGPGCNLPLRAGKGWLYEGGVREPTIIRAPGVTKPGSVSRKPMVSMDFFPTMLELAGLPAQPKLHADGQSLVAQLKGNDSGTRTLYWHYPHYHGSAWKPGASIRDGDWKLIEFYHYKNFELYNLATDPGEQKNLAASNSKKANELRAKLAAWQKKMNAKMPVANPDYKEPKPKAEAKIKKAATFLGKPSDWHGFALHEFQRNGVNCKVVTPKKAAAGRPWIWRARFWGHEPQTDLALLAKGWHVVYCDVADLFGSPKAVARWNDFYRYLTTTHRLAPKAALEGMSRGGLIIYNWAAANPEKVSCIYGDAPVCVIKSWPGQSRKAVWKKCIDAYGITSEEALRFKGNPIDHLAPLAKAKIPLLHVVGDADKPVPVSENTAILEARYKKLGGTIQVIHKPGIGHHPHSLKDPKPIVDFILKHAGR